jgi:hypothetical protein
MSGSGVLHQPVKALDGAPCVVQRGEDQARGAWLRPRALLQLLLRLGRGLRGGLSGVAHAPGARTPAAEAAEASAQALPPQAAAPHKRALALEPQQRQFDDDTAGEDTDAIVQALPPHAAAPHKRALALEPQQRQFDDDTAGEDAEPGAPRRPQRRAGGEYERARLPAGGRPGARASRAVYERDTSFSAAMAPPLGFSAAATEPAAACAAVAEHSAPHAPAAPAALLGERRRSSGDQRRSSGEHRCSAGARSSGGRRRSSGGSRRSSREARGRRSSAERRASVDVAELLDRSEFWNASR